MTINELAKLEFHNKETYLFWRLQWRADYAELSRCIRQNRTEIRERQKNRQYAGTLQSANHRLRWEAKELLEIRKQSKIKAQQQYLAHKAARTLQASAAA